MTRVTVTGGNKSGAYLAALADRMTKGEVQVGFLEGSTYPAGEKNKPLHVAQVAFWNNFGTTRTPPRPFFSNMVRDQSPRWGKQLAAVSKAANFDTAVSLGRMGEHIKDQLVKAIVDWPADNAPSTAQRKGFNKGLIDTGVMQRSVGVVVKT